jgi:2,3,4,5-tetrahydropyridine-2,6-dicarboxylate N-succinyltransferase
MELQQLIQEAYANRTLLQEAPYKNAVLELVEKVDKGMLRTAEPIDGKWQVNEWVKQGILMYFGVMPMQVMQQGPEQYYDKIPLKMGMQELGIRTVPGSIIRHGAYVSKGVICMPSFINIGAYVDEGTMVDTWATVGSCAQIGKHVHLSGGVGIGGVLEPLQASPVIIEDNAFIGSRCIVVEGVIVEKEAVLGANVVLTQSTKIIDVSGAKPMEYKGRVPARSVVIPGSYTKKFNAGEYQVNCALIIGQRKESTDTKTSLNDALRDFGVSV